MYIYIYIVYHHIEPIAMFVYKTLQIEPLPHVLADIQYTFSILWCYLKI